LQDRFKHTQIIFLAGVSPGRCKYALFFNFLPGSFDAAVTQKPRYLIKMKGQEAEMKCIPEKGHTAVFWYQQKQSKELKFLIYFQNQQPLDQIDMVKERFSAVCPSSSLCSLGIRTCEAEDSALYLCSSSQSTALKCALPLHTNSPGSHLGSR
jgi:T-cell receptor beta chain V region